MRAILIFSLSSLPAISCDLERILAANGRSPTGSQIANAYKAAVDLLVHDVGPSLDLKRLLADPFDLPTDAPSQLRTLWKDLKAIHDGLTPGQREAARKAMRAHLERVFDGEKKRDTSREAEASPTEIWASPMRSWGPVEKTRLDIFDSETGKVHEFPLASGEAQDEWRLTPARDGWGVAIPRRSREVYFWNPIRGVLVKASPSPFVGTSGILGKLRTVLPSSVENAEFSDRGTRALVVVSQNVKYPFRKSKNVNTAAVYDPTSGALIRPWRHSAAEKIRSGTLSSDGREAWFVSPWYRYRWKIDTDVTTVFKNDHEMALGPILSRPNDGVVSVHWLNGGNHVATYDALTGKELRVVDLTNGYSTFSPDGRWLVELRDEYESATQPRAQRVWLHRLLTGQKRKLVFERPSPLVHVRFSDDGRQLLISPVGTTSATWVYDLASVLENAGIRIPTPETEATP